MLFLEISQKKTFISWRIGPFYKLLKRFGNLPYTLCRSLIDNLPTIQLLHWLIVISSVQLEKYQLLFICSSTSSLAYRNRFEINSQEIYWKVWHLLTSALGIMERVFQSFDFLQNEKSSELQLKTLNLFLTFTVQTSPVQFQMRRRKLLETLCWFLSISKWKRFYILDYFHTVWRMEQNTTIKKTTSIK